MSEPGPAPNPFWDYSLARYERPGVAEACIGLQDRLGADVNVLLFCCWAGHRGHRLSAEQLGRLLDASRPWQRDIVEPLRQVRRQLKPQAGESKEIEALRGRVKALELESERIAQAQLQSCLPLDEGRSSRHAVAANLQLYVESLPVRLGDSDHVALALLHEAGG